MKEIDVDKQGVKLNELEAEESTEIYATHGTVYEVKSKVKEKN